LSKQIHKAAGCLVNATLLWFLVLSACSSSQLQPQQAILGQWMNEQGGELYFYEDGTGFIPGNSGAINIPDVKFTYLFPDNTHLSLEMAGQQALTLVISIEGDKMTWRGVASGKEFVYTRRK